MGGQRGAEGVDAKLPFLFFALVLEDGSPPLSRLVAARDEERKSRLQGKHTKDTEAVIL